MRQTDNGSTVTSTTAFGLEQKIANRTARVGVVGLGYVGLPTLVGFATTGFDVTGLDIDQSKVDQINAGQSYIEDVDSETLARLVRERQVRATTDTSLLEDLDVIMICVPTPVDVHKEPDLTPLKSATQAVAAHLRTGQLVILQSTTFPGTTEELLLPALQESGLKVGEDFFLAFSPERIDYGNRQYMVANTPKVVAGVTPQCCELTVVFFSSLVEKVIPVSSPKVAECTKLLENIFRSVNIALVNELSELCQRMDVDLWEVIHAAASKPFGFMPFYPGIGVGGHCIPVDPFYLSWKAKEYDFYLDFIELAAKTNDNRPYYVVSRIGDILGKQGTLLQGAELLLLGISFKRDVKDTRNSPAVRVAELLQEKGAKIAYSDPYVPEVTIGETPLTSVDLGTANLQDYAATIILVNHTSPNLAEVVDQSQLVIDAVDATRPLGSNPKIVKL